LRFLLRSLAAKKQEGGHVGDPEGDTPRQGAGLACGPGFFLRCAQKARRFTKKDGGPSRHQDVTILIFQKGYLALIY
jgi:hypothetical protein